jgi:hypothetical protein
MIALYNTLCRSQTFIFQQKTLAICLETALINDQVEFVKLFTDYGVIENKFLTVLQLRSLYIKAVQL